MSDRRAPDSVSQAIEPVERPAARSVASRVPAPDEIGIAVSVRTLQAEGRDAEAHRAYTELVLRHQRRAARIAYHYLRDASDADEVVQDAFIKAYTHMASYREDWPFEVWFTRILVNACLDRRKSRARRDRWFVSADEATPRDEARAAAGHPSTVDPEARLLARERRVRLAAAIGRLEGRQRMVFLLCHIGDSSPRDVSAIMGLKESTVRVHLFRAARRLRTLLGGQP